jgi:diguanylate cyclase (GGDEF)-like protein
VTDTGLATDARTRTRARRGGQGRLRGRIFASGALVAVAIGVAALIVLSPVTRAQSDLHQISHDGLPVQAQLVALRTTLTEWQFFLEPHFDTLVPGAVPQPAQLAKGAQLAVAQTAQAKALEQSLTRIGFAADARDLRTTMADLDASITKLTPVATGNLGTRGRLQTLIAAERDAIQRVWSSTARISAHLSNDITAQEVKQATRHLALGRWMFLIAASLDLLLVLCASLILGLRAGIQERARSRKAIQREYEARLQKALEMANTETDVYGIVGSALHESLPRLKIEMLIADSSRAHFRRALTNDTDFEGCGVISPLDCPAIRRGQDLVFPTSRALDACPHLKGRESGHCSAACLPVSLAGLTIGVTHVVGHDGTPPAGSEIESVNFTSRNGAERIAMIRAFEASESEAHTDPLTGLLNRRSLEIQVRDLRNEGTPYTVAYGDLDNFKILNDTHGHDAGDHALRAFSRVLRDSVRPNDIVARYGGEEFVIVLPDCGTDVAVGVLERVRERLALSLRSGRVPPFTVTFGVASTAYAPEFDEIILIADRALLDAKGAGRNRVVVADFPVATAAVAARLLG